MKIFIETGIAAAIFFLITACAASKTTSTEVITGKKIAFAENGITFNIPDNWFSVNGAESGLDAWLVNKDYSSAIVFYRINSNADEDPASLYSARAGLKYLETLYKTAGKITFENSGSIMIDGENYSSAYFKSDNQYSGRIVIINIKGINYACVSVNNNPSGKSNETLNLQKSILKKIAGN